MSNVEKYNAIFADAFQIEESEVNSDLTIMTYERWDSVAHMTITAAIEDAFDIMFDTDDIIDFNSYDSGKEVLRKYGVDI